MCYIIAAVTISMQVDVGIVTETHIQGMYYIGVCYFAVVIDLSAPLTSQF